MSDIRTTSQLPDFSGTLKEALFAVSEKMRADQYGLVRYSSRKMTGKKLTDAVYENIQENLRTNYGLTENVRLDNLNNCISTLVNGNDASGLIPPYKNMVYQGNHDFDKLPKFHETLSSFDAEYDNCAVNIGTLKNFEDSSNALMINSGASFNTTYFNVENNDYLILSGIGDAPDAANKYAYHETFIFRIQGYQSNEWTVPANGMFTCYGWVDEKNGDDAADDSKRWVALEGKFYNENGPYDDGNGNHYYWKILSLQPVAKNPYCTYVGFTFPVNQGMQLRLRSGFNVGTNSNKYESVNGSLTNHIANAFVGGVYNKHSWGYSVAGGGGGTGEDKYIEGIDTVVTPSGVLSINLTRYNGPDQATSSLTSSVDIPNTYPTSLSMIPVEDVLSLGLEFNNQTISPLTTTINKSIFVQWLSADIFNAIIAALPDTIVTNVSESNLGIDTTTPALSSNVAFRMARWNGNYNRFDTDENDTVTTTGTTVAGTSCGHGTFSSKSPTFSQNTEDNEDEERYSKLIEEVKKEIEE